MDSANKQSPNLGFGVSAGDTDRHKKADDLADATGSNEDLFTMREINPLTLFIKIVPSTYDVVKDCGLVVKRQSLFAIVTVVPAPGVDVWRCYESVCRECSCALVRDERLMLLARLRMYATDITGLLVGERNRRIPLDGVNPFVCRAHEFETVNNITSILKKRHGDKMSDLKIIGVAHPETDQEIKHHAKASDGYIDRTITWRTKFTSACDFKRQDVANLFPWIPKMPVFTHFEPRSEDDENFSKGKFGYIQGVITMELFQPLDVSPTMKWEDFKIGEYPESVKVHSSTLCQNICVHTPASCHRLLP